jgi:hypothetical protein
MRKVPAAGPPTRRPNTGWPSKRGTHSQSMAPCRAAVDRCLGQNLAGGKRRGGHPPYHPSAIADAQGGHPRGKAQLDRPHILIANHLPSRHVAGHHQHRHPLAGPLHHRHRPQHTGKQQR